MAENKTKQKKSNLDTQIKGVRVPPHSQEAEIQVLGAMMLSREAISKVITIFGTDRINQNKHRNKLSSTKVFFDPRHQEIYNAIVELDERNMAPDIFLVSEHLKKNKKLELAGGTYYLTEISRQTPTYANVESYARLVQEHYFKRALIDTAEHIIERSYDITSDALIEIDNAESDIFAIAEQRISNKYKPIKEVAEETQKWVEGILKNEKSEYAVDTGFIKLNNLLNGGFQKSDLIILAARPSMGKTAFALALALNAAMKNIPTAFFSIEMVAKELVMRLVGSLENINVKHLINIRYQKTMEETIRGFEKLKMWPLYFDDSHSLSIMELRAKCRRLKAETQIQFIVIDYLQLIESLKADSREREIAIISKTLKQIARELEVPVLALSQLNRGVETRTGKDKIPMLSDLRESGSIEQDADVVMFIHRPWYYEQHRAIETLSEVERKEVEDSKLLAQIIISKHRNGPTGMVELNFNSETGKFDPRTNESMPVELQNYQKQNNVNQTSNTQQSNENVDNKQDPEF